MKHKMAIIGYGGMAGYHHENLNKYFPEIEIAGIYDIREEAVKKAREKGLACFDSPEQIYQNRDIELVLVATPNDFHKPYAIACLEAGKNVISEKPVTLNAAELEEIIAAAEKAGKFFTVHQNRRWDKDFLIVKKIFAGGLLRDPYVIESRVQGSRRGLHGWRGWKQNGGGMVLDWGVHLIDQMLNFADGQKVIAVSAVLHNVFAPEVDDNFTASFRFENGLNYIVNVAMNSFILQPRWHISAADGTCLIQNWECEGKIVKLAGEKNLEWAEDIVYTAAGPTRSMAPRPSETTTELPLPEVTGNQQDYYRNILEALEGRAEPVVKTGEALRVMKLIDLVFLSNEKKCGIACSI
ncbi:MAG: Gfo/Idh/MocA family oxidoreductase [Treponema sp.]|jgi:predicted dehydrogenase|nr:Gfo/Idh/MocA family oxidoreductase [Treponema sp.]